MEPVLKQYSQIAGCRNDLEGCDYTFLMERKEMEWIELEKQVWRSHNKGKCYFVKL